MEPVPIRFRIAWGPVEFELGIIAGDRSINWINSAFIAGRDDGKVSVERTKLAGMKEHLVIHASHPFLMRNDHAIRAALQFLRTGTFAPSTCRDQPAAAVTP